MKIVGYVVVSITAVVLGVIFSGYALSILWSWFVSPTFGIVALNIPEAIGVALVVSFLAKEYPEEDKTNKKSFGEIMGRLFMTAIFRPAFALFTGWVITLFM